VEKVKVMVVDDSKVSCMILEDIISRTNFEICAFAANTTEAIEKYREMRPTVVTMDMNLPDHDGIECSRRIHAMDPDAKIVMISAMRDASLMAKGQEAGISAFLQKPINENELIDTLMLLCQNKVGTIVVLRESYAKPFSRAFQQGLFSLSGVHSEAELTQEEGRYLEVNGIAVILGITGKPRGRAILYMDASTMQKFSRVVLGRKSDAEVSKKEIGEAVEEAANIIVGHGVSTINDIFQDREMRVTPPGTLYGENIRIANPKLISFKISAATRLGTIYMNIGFAGGE
jgi:two-component system, response regulator PdtaR